MVALAEACAFQARATGALSRPTLAQPTARRARCRPPYESEQRTLTHTTPLAGAPASDKRFVSRVDALRKHPRLFSRPGTPSAARTPAPMPPRARSHPCLSGPCASLCVCTRRFARLPGARGCALAPGPPNGVLQCCAGAVLLGGEAISRPSAPSWLLRSAALFASAWSTLLRTWPVLTSACQLLSQTPPDRVRSELRNTPLRGHVGSASAVAPCRPAPPVPTLPLPPCPWPLATKPCVTR